MINAAHAEHVKVVLTVTMMAWDGNYAAMTSLLNSPTKRTQLAAEIAATVADRNADGVNLDFEPMPNSLEDAYTAFVRDVKAALGSRYLTVATTGGAASWDEGYDLAALVAPGRRRRDHGDGLRLQLGRLVARRRRLPDRQPVRAGRPDGDGRTTSTSCPRRS